MRENREPRQRDVETSGGNYNEQIQGNYIQSLIISALNVSQSGQEKASESQAVRPKNEQILLADVKSKVNPWLNQCLQNKVLIPLRKEQQPEQVERPWDTEVKIGTKPPEPLSDDINILDIFDRDEINGKLLILGAPGSGKTITMLELAKALIERAEQQPENPIPVLFNLSSWQNDRSAFQKWLVSELKLNYGVRSSISKQWLENRQLLPILDGLDEVPLHQQSDCVKAINQFLESETRPSHLVVCSRIDNYKAYEDNLHLSGAICLLELTDAQIRNFLSEVKQTNFWQLVQNDEKLLCLVRNPLFLCVATLVFSQISSQDLQQITSSKNPLQRLLDAYIRQMFTRTLKQKKNQYNQKSSPNVKETRTKLCWLAEQMQQEHKTSFFIEQMQPPLLLKTSSQRFFYRLVLVLVCGAIGQIVGLLVLGLAALLNLTIGKQEYGKEYKIPSSEDIEEFVSKNVEEAEQALDNEEILSKKLIIILMFFVFSIELVYILCTGFNEFGFTSIKVQELENFYPIIKLLLHFIGFIAGSIIGFNIGLREIKTIEAFKLPLRQEEFRVFQNDFHDGFDYGFKTRLMRCPNIKVHYWAFLLATPLIISVLLLIFKKILLALIPLLILFGAVFLLINFWIFGIVLGVSRGVILGFVQGLRVDVNSKLYPNQGIIQSTKNSLVLSTSFLVVLCLPIFSNDLASWILAVYFMPVTDFGFGGLACIQHFALRVTLWKGGFVRWNYARLLNYYADRLLLQKVGGRYQFMHKLLQDHFAHMRL